MNTEQHSLDSFSKEVGKEDSMEESDTLDSIDKVSWSQFF